MTDQFDNIPNELKRLRQFCVWKLEDRGGPKPTKPLYRLDGRKASVTNPDDWCSFDDAVNALRTTDQFNGLGFVFTEQDEYCGIDIDVPKNEAEEALRDKVWHAFPSYSELSPSGKGVHIIVKGSLPTGRRRMSIEVYSSHRYFTMTGDVMRNMAITDQQANLDILWNEMGQGQKPNPYFETEDGEQLRADDDIIKVAANAANGAKFQRLNEGNIEGYPSQSEADQAYLNMLAFYSDSRSQIARIFLASPLGQREKAWKHPSYLRNSIFKAFDRKLPPIDMEGVRASLEAMLAAPAPQRRTGPTGEPVSWPPGLIGEIADFIYRQAPRPVADIALVGAIGLVAGICGQAYNVSGSGLNQYLILIAQTGRGKEAIASGIGKLISAVAEKVPSAADFIGPGDMASGAGLIKWLENQSCFVSVLGEIGHRLAAICSPTAPSHEINLKSLLLDLYQKSGYRQALYPKAYSTKTQREHVVIERPAFTLVGESTPEKFFEALDDSLIADGFLPRFLVFQYDGERKYLAEDFAKAQPSGQLIQKLVELVTHCREVVDGKRVEVVQFSVEAEQMMKEFDYRTTDMINDFNTDARFAELYNRAHMKAMRLAALVSVGINPLFPVISKECAQWAIDVVMRDINNMIYRFRSGETGIKRDGNQMEHIQIIREVLRGWFTGETKGTTYGLSDKMIKEGVFSTSALNVRLNGNKAFKQDRRGVPAAVKDALKVMTEDAEIVEILKIEMKNRFDKTCLAYQYVEFEKLKG